MCIRDSVYYFPVDLYESGEIIFFTDSDSEAAIGTLNLYKNGETQKIVDDVFTEYRTTSQGNILFLYDVDFSGECAELGVYADGKVQKIDNDVQYVLHSNLKKHKIINKNWTM